MHSTVIISFLFVFLLEPICAVPQIYTHLFRVPAPVSPVFGTANTILSKEPVAPVARTRQKPALSYRTHRAYYESCTANGGDRVHGQCLIFNQEPKTWLQAVSACAAKGQRLAVIDDSGAVNSYLQNNYAGKDIWLGASDIETENGWVWVNGQSAQSLWARSPIKPNNFREYHDCLAWGYENNYYDWYCTNPLPYICELEEDYDYMDYLNDYYNDLETDNSNGPGNGETTTSTPASTASCQSPWFKAGSECFFGVKSDLSDAGGTDWYSARTKCSELADGADLAQPNDLVALEEALMANGHQSGWGLWVGGSDTETVDDYRWLNGSSMTTGWYVGSRPQYNQPNHNGVSCVQMYPGRGHNSMTDLSCHADNGFVCERY